MRIDFVITELFVGGAERCLTELAIGLAARGDQVRVFSLAALPLGPQRQLVDRLQDAGIEVDSGDADSPRQFWTAYQRLRRWFALDPPQLCQTFLFHANVLGTRAARAAGVPLIVAGVRVAEARPLRCWIERHALQRIDAVVCVSGAVADFAERRLGCDRARIVVIPNAVDVPRFQHAAPADWTTLGWPADAVVSLFVGRLDPQKGIDLLQRQIDALAPPDSSRRLLLIGGGPLQRELNHWCQQIGSDRVRLLPWQTDVAPWMAAARLLVLPSRYEGMPNVVLEAMAAGKPVVCSRVEGTAELFAHDGGSQTFACGDHAAMARLAQRFIDDAALGTAVGQTNQARMQNDFSISAMVDAYRSYYQSLDKRRLDPR